MAEPAPTSTSTLEYAGPSTPRRPVTNWPTWLAAAAVVALLAALIIPAISRRPSRHAPELRCRSNMRQIGIAIAMYMNDHGGHTPDTLNRVLETQDIAPEAFVCAASQDERAAGPTTQAVAAGLTAGGHLSYVYLGGGLKSPDGGLSLDPDVVVLLEPPSNHGTQGTNVLFGDWSVQWIKGPAVRAITDQANADIRPVVWPRKAATQPATRPATGPAR